MKISSKTKHCFIGAILASCLVFSFLLFVGNVGKGSTRLVDALLETVVAQTAPLTSVTNVVAHRATAPELFAFRSVFMAEFMAKTAEARQAGDFLFAGQRVDSATVGKATAFKKAHDFETVGPVSAFMVQLRDNPASADYQAIFGEVPLVSYVPPRAYVLMLTEAELSRVSALDLVEFVFEVTEEYKIDPFLAWLAKKSQIDLEVDVLVNLYAQADEQAVAQRLRVLGVVLDKAESFSGVKRMKGSVALSKLSDIAAIGGVEWIEKKAEMKLSNNLAVMEPRMNVVAVWNPWGLEGEGQLVGHADTGLDTGNTNTLHLDMRGRVTGSATWNERGAWSDLNSHGTHTAGSIVGNGAESGGQFSGVAPKAHLYHQSIGTDAAGNLALPDDLAYLFDQAAQNGAYIHSDSWGDATFGLYSIYEEMADTYVWGNQNFLPVFAAGNDGTDGYYSAITSNYLAGVGIVISNAVKDGVIDLQSIISPSHAKNVLAVGATESDRTSGPKSTRTYSSLWPSDFSVDPIKSDYATVGLSNSNGYFQGMAAFSSRGPTYCGRTKPDVTAPGCDVVSTRSTMSSGTGWGVYTPNPKYFYNGGTSMACPLAAGAATLVREHLVEREGIETPTAALIRATLVNGAESLFPGQYGTGAFQEIPAESPNSVEGWGQVNVGGTLYQQGSGNLFIDRIFNGTLRSGESGWLDVTVVNTNVPLRLTLTWADYPLRPWAAYNHEVVNDLDVVVVTPSSEILWGNGVDDGDRSNTVERVIIQNPQLGTYTVNIIAHNIMVTGSLPALVISGGIEEAQPIVLPKLIEDTSPRLEGYPAMAHVHSVFPYMVTNPVDFAWAIGDANSATGSWTQVAVAAEVDGETYLATIAGPLVVGEVYYVWDVPDAYTSITNRFSILPYDVVPAAFSQTFGYIGGATNFSVAANTEWFAESTNDWIDISAGAGTNTGVAAYSVMTNFVAASRNGVILVFGGDVTNTVSVLQGAWNKQPDMPQLAAPVFSMNGGQASLSFMGERNTVYTLQGKVTLTDPEWIDLDTQTVYDNGIVTLIATTFPSYPTLPDTAFFRIKAVALVPE